MAIDAALLGRVRDRLTTRADVSEVRMMGGLVFMVGGHMCCGVKDARLMVRLGEAGARDALAEPHTRPLAFGTRTAKAFVLVDGAGLGSDAELDAWIVRALRFVRTLPEVSGETRRRKKI